MGSASALRCVLLACLAACCQHCGRASCASQSCTPALTLPPPHPHTHTHTRRLSPGGALAVGLFAGALSTFGFGCLSDVLERRINLGDTCGVHVSRGSRHCAHGACRRAFGPPRALSSPPCCVLRLHSPFTKLPHPSRQHAPHAHTHTHTRKQNLHGMPGLLGGLVAGLAAFSQPPGIAPRGSAQLGYQIAAMACTVAIAGCGGALVSALATGGGVRARRGEGRGGCQ
jgi:hypothetical protein